MALPRNWERLILRGIGAPATPQNVRFLDAWQKAEGGGTANNANFNPLNTTQGASGAGSINSVGVKSYRSPGQGIRATVQTLLNGRYGDIVSGLRSGRASAAQLASSQSLGTWGTGGGVRRVLGSGYVSPPKLTGSGPGSVAASQPSSSQAASGGAPGGFRQAVAAYLIENSQRLAEGGKIDPNSILQLALARQQLSQPPEPAVRLAQRSQARGGGGKTAPFNPGGVQFTGKPLSGERPDFLNKITRAVKAVGGTKVEVVSGYRSPAHNRAVGGATHSNHMYGRAMDGRVYIPGRGWVDLGTALAGVAPKFGLRSGATFNYGGRPDTPHVDDAFNQR